MDRVQQKPLQASPPPQVSARWLLSALALLVLASGCCAYLTLCLLFLQGQWQLLYHPNEHQPGSEGLTPSAVGLAFTPVRFGASEEGTPELSGWWMPAGGTADQLTILYLHGSSGSLQDTLPALKRLHALGATVFAIDYRGNGLSAAGHPSEASMVEDAGRAIEYLLGTRHVKRGSLVLWGDGVGATIAAESGQGLPMVLEKVNRPAIDLLKEDPRTRYLPVRLLLRDRLDAGTAVRGSSAVKLFLLAGGPETEPSSLAASPDTRRLYSLASDPKKLADSANTEAVRAFLKSASSP